MEPLNKMITKKTYELAKQIVYDYEKKEKRDVMIIEYNFSHRFLKLIERINAADVLHFKLTHLSDLEIAYKFHRNKILNVRGFGLKSEKELLTSINYIDKLKK